MYNLEGKTVFVTGAGGEHGIGRGIALRLAEDGADIVLTDLVERPYPDADWEGLPALRAEIETMGRRALAVTCDVTDSVSVEGAMQRAVEEFGRIDILVNNAAARGGRDRVPVVDLDENEWDRVMSVNLKGTFVCSRAAARHMVARRRRWSHNQRLLSLGVAWDCPICRLLLIQIRNRRPDAGPRPGVGRVRGHRQRNLPQLDPHRASRPHDQLIHQPVVASEGSDRRPFIRGSGKYPNRPPRPNRRPCPCRFVSGLGWSRFSHRSLNSSDRWILHAVDASLSERNDIPC